MASQDPDSQKGASKYADKGESKPLEIIRRLYAIMQLVKSPGGGPRNMPDFQEKLAEQGFEGLSRRTVFRHITYLRNAFGIHIEYDHSRKQYRIMPREDEVADQAQLDNLIDMVSMSGRLDQLLASSTQLRQFVRYEHEESLRQVLDTLELLLKAIVSRRIVSMRYQSYHRDKAKAYIVEPYCIAERNNRWYFIGYDLRGEMIRTFGLDRIQENSLVIKKSKFDNFRGFDFERRFEFVVGIETADEKPEEISFWADKKQSKYLESLPIHHSQERLKEEDDGWVFQIKVIPNLELEMEFLKLGEKVKVLKPKSFKKQIKNRLKKALEQY